MPKNQAAPQRSNTSARMLFIGPVDIVAALIFFSQLSDGTQGASWEQSVVQKPTPRF